MPERLTKPVLRVLEECFAAEIQGMPAQLPRGKCYVAAMRCSQAAQAAYRDGLIEPTQHFMRFNDRLPGMTIYGFALTHRGRIAYCRWASEQVGDADA